MPLMHADSNVVFHEARKGMVVLLQEKTEKWSGVIESKWESFKMAHDREMELTRTPSSSPAEKAALQEHTDGDNRTQRKAAVVGREFVKRVTASEDKPAQNGAVKRPQSAGSDQSTKSKKLKKCGTSGAVNKRSQLQGVSSKEGITPTTSIRNSSDESDSESEGGISLDKQQEEYLKKLKNKTKAKRPPAKSKKSKDQGEQVKKVAQQEAVGDFLKDIHSESHPKGTPQRLFQSIAVASPSPIKHDLHYQHTPPRRSVSPPRRSSPRLKGPTRQSLSRSPRQSQKQSTRRSLSRSPRQSQKQSTRRSPSPSPRRTPKQSTRRSPKELTRRSPRRTPSPEQLIVVHRTPTRESVSLPRRSSPRLKLRYSQQGPTSRSPLTPPRRSTVTPPRRSSPRLKLNEPLSSSTPRQSVHHASTSAAGLSEEEQLNAALTSMSQSNKPIAIEQRLSNCEKVLRLMLQVQIATVQNTTKLQQADEEAAVAGQLCADLKKKTRDAVKSASTAGDAVRCGAKVVFTMEELLSCTVRGRHTNKSAEKRDALDKTRLKFFMSTIQKAFTDAKDYDLHTILGDFLKKNRTRAQSSASKKKP